MLDQQKIDSLRATDIAPQQLFIDGKWQAPQGGKTLDVISPIDGQILTTIGAAEQADVDLAVGAAESAFQQGSWSKMPPAQRKKIMHRIADLIEQHALELAVLGVRDNGTEIGMAINAEPGSAAATFRYYAEAIDKAYGEIAPTGENVLGLVHREAIGVVGCIVPWNFPLMIGAWKIAPALAAGNSVVLKPSEDASLSLLKLTQLCAQAGLPDGVFNVVTGLGDVTGEALAMHNQVDVLAFTGSGFIGRKLLQYSAQSNLKRVYLELGGKSPNIIFADAPNLKQAAQVSAMSIFRNSGEVCVAASRLLVQKSVQEEFMGYLVEATQALKVGDPLDLTNQIGAVCSAAQLKKDLLWAEKAQQDGAQLVCGGQQLHTESGGYYMQPTIFSHVTPDMPLACEEVFGPILSVIGFDDEEDAIAIANDSDFGLSSAVWTSNLSRAHKMVRAIKAGVVHVNTYGGPDITVPMGGMKQSGNGADKSMHALDKYTDLKTAWIQL